VSNHTQASSQWVPLTAVAARIIAFCASSAPSALSQRADAATAAALDAVLAHSAACSAAHSAAHSTAAGTWADAHLWDDFVDGAAAVPPAPGVDSAGVRAMLRRCFPPALPKVSLWSTLIFK